MTLIFSWYERTGSATKLKIVEVDVTRDDATRERRTREKTRDENYNFESFSFNPELYSTLHRDFPIREIII